jgi:23S rRNA pseudouridine955/2504/2580 synthase
VRALEPLATATLCEARLETGRTHQIRVHLAHEGHPIVGDEKYGDFALNKALARGDVLPGHRVDRMFLHARRLRFEHPASGETIELEAPLPPDFQAFLDVLGP